MSIKPIDLQTLFSHMNQVGKDQAAMKDAVVMQQAATADELVKETQQKDESVNETKATSEGPEHIDEDGNPRQPEQQEGQKRREKKDAAKKRYFSDPDLGSHIDIEG